MKRGYHKLSLKVHPDRVSAKDKDDATLKFQTLGKVYSILSDIGKEIHYALDTEERQAIMDVIVAEKKKGKILETRFKGLGEMNPLQLRESTIDPDTRRLVQLTIDSDDKTTRMMDMLLGKKRASDRKAWLEDKGDLASA